MEEGCVSCAKYISGESLNYGEIKENFERDEHKADCYAQCVNDAWDLKDESFCASVCMS